MTRHKVQICDERAAFDLLGATLVQCRKDITQKGIDFVDRASAFELFAILGGFIDENDESDGGAGRQGGDEIRATSRQDYVCGGGLGSRQGAQIGARAI